MKRTIITLPVLCLALLGAAVSGGWAKDLQFPVACYQGEELKQLRQWSSA